jgi:beta-xylosidase
MRCLLLLPLISALSLAAEPVTPPTPILEGYTADPSIRVFGDTYYIYPHLR